MLETKKNTINKFLSENDKLIGHLIVIIQMNITSDVFSRVIEVYNILYEIVKIKAAFVYIEFFDYIYGMISFYTFI